MSIVVYASEHCRACQRVKEFLSRTGKPFVVRDVDEDPEAFRELATLGLMTIPVTIVGDRIVRGFDEKALAAAIGDAHAGCVTS